MLCKTCPRRLTCSNICTEVKEYISQDYVPRRETFLLDPDSITHLSYGSSEDKDKRKQILEEIFDNIIKQSDLSNKIGVSQGYVSRVIKEAKLKLEIK